jgi:hypothetical protein
MEHRDNASLKKNINQAGLLRLPYDFQHSAGRDRNEVHSILNGHGGRL